MVPGAPIILAAAVMHKYFLPEFLTLWTLGALAVLAVISVLLDTAFSLGGAKYYGATAWGMLGGGVGAVIGIFWGPVGMLLGAVAGAMLCELLFAKRSWRGSARAGVGAGLGLLASSAGRFILCLCMVGLFIADCLF